uniref:Holin n=1 Tax=Arsenophonus endosymbiont of Trialeurodes vaporariorum TaxID=235567 RepID=A0A3B0MIN6_9GAMM
MVVTIKFNICLIFVSIKSFKKVNPESGGYTHMPKENDVLLWCLIGLFSAWGGATRYKYGKKSKRRWIAMIFEMITSCFTGFIGGLLAMEYGSSDYIALVVAGLLGSMGGTGLKLLYQKVFNLKVDKK